MSRAFRLGIFIVTTLMILAAGVFIIGDKRFLFRRTYRLSAQFQNVAGLANGSDVQVGGIHMGTVRNISLPDDPQGELTVWMDMSDPTRSIIRKDSVATIKTEGLLGDKYVEISFGSAKAPLVENGDQIKGQTPEDFSDAALAAANQAKATTSAFQEDADALKDNFLLRGFFQRRGYEDASDLKENLISQLPSQPASKEFTYDAKDLFTKPDDAKLKNQKKLKDAGEFLEQNKFRLVVVAVSATVGDTAKDRVLTVAQAKVTRDYLVQNFKIEDTRLKIIGLGKATKTGQEGQVKILVFN